MSEAAVDINAESVNDRVKLMLHRVIAKRISSCPELIDVARSKLEMTSHGADYVSEWLEILAYDPIELRRLITTRAERMVRLRKSSPFTQPDFQNPDFRRRVWWLARRGVK